ncbi:hypothetical protein BC940DRAFT_293396 [Gongronella butleri]|nr:hypothetical protein BC940DRAFT_293396 [Gongronella butleri]
MSQLPSCLKHSRCILHIDLDCYFCQVEQVRLGMSPDQPLAVQQWSNLIAVNYEARKYGVSRHCDKDEARRLCPEITLVHVATFAPNEDVAGYHENPSRSTHKVDLSPYRNASKEIFRIFKSHCPLLQKCGTDEAFLDVTALVNKRLCEEYIPQHPELMERLDDTFLPEHMLDWDAAAFLVKSDDEKESEKDGAPLVMDKTSWKDVQLYLGAIFAASIRKQVYDDLHYTCSAGIAHNKVQAKLCSSMHKPNKQTVLREHLGMQFMQEVPFRKIRNLGGKLGELVEAEYQAKMASDLWQYSMEDLQAKFGASNGTYLYNVVRGIDHEEVILTKAAKSLIASKSMQPVLKRHQDVEPWFGILASELYGRIMEQWEQTELYPKTMTVSYKCTRDPAYRSKSMAMINRHDLKSMDVLRAKIQHVVEQQIGIKDVLPCSHLAVSVSGLAYDESLSSHDISKFFSAASASSASTSNGTSNGTTSSNIKDEHPAPANDASTKLAGKNASPLLQFFQKCGPDAPPDASDTNTIKDDDDQVASKGKDDDDPLTWKCDRCHEAIPVDKIEEHTDFHFAQDLMQQERQSIPPSSTSANKRPTPKNQQPDAKKPRHSFFQP